MTLRQGLRKIRQMKGGFFKKIACVSMVAYLLAACSNITPATSQSHSANGSKGTRGRASGQRATISYLNNPNSRFFSMNSLSLNANSGNLWDVIPYGFQIDHDKANPQVQKQLAWFAKHPEYVSRVAKRAAPYLYYIYEQVQQRQLPTEFVLLPFNESAYSPFVNSNRGAVGIWQMARGTALQYGVKQNWWYDGRRDIYASTQAALDHLTYLRNFFNGDWLLAIAAYDCGEGTVQRAVRRNARLGRPTDFWSLALPEETRSYVPRLLALAIIISEHKDYDLDLIQIDDEPYLAQVDVSQPITLTDAAHLAGLSTIQLKQLNPGYKYWTHIANGPFKLVLPIDKISAFKENLASYSPGSRKIRPSIAVSQLASNATSTTSIKVTLPANAIIHNVKAGDNLSSIAKIYKVSVAQIMRWNHLTSVQLAANSQLIVGFPDAASRNLAEKSLDTPTPAAPAASTLSAASKMYVVKSGDTLSRIAKRHHMTQVQLAQINNISLQSRLKLGQQLVVQAKS